MAIKDSSAADREFFTYPGVFAMLTECAKRHSPEILMEAARMVDMRPSTTLRGLSYLTWALAQVPREEIDPEQQTLAMQTVAELSALVASLIDLQNDAAIIELCGVEPKLKAV